MLPTLFVLLAVAAPPITIPSADDAHVLLADDWARPRTGEAVVALPAPRAAVRAWHHAHDASLVIAHPGGERGSLWGAEVRDWLVALGVEPSRILLRPGGPRDDAVVLSVEAPR